MTQVKRQPQSSASSQFLNNEDSTIVVKILGPRCPSLATSVVQIYMSDATTGTQCPRTDLSKRFLPKPMTTTG